MMPPGRTSSIKMPAPEAEVRVPEAGPRNLPTERYTITPGDACHVVFANHAGRDRIRLSVDQFPENPRTNGTPLGNLHLFPSHITNMDDSFADEVLDAPDETAEAYIGELMDEHRRMGDRVFAVWSSGGVDGTLEVLAGAPAENTPRYQADLVGMYTVDRKEDLSQDQALSNLAYEFKELNSYLQGNCWVAVHEQAVPGAWQIRASMNAFTWDEAAAQVKAWMDADADAAWVRWDLAYSGRGEEWKPAASVNLDDPF